MAEERESINLGDGDILLTGSHCVIEWSCNQVACWLRSKGHDENLVQKLCFEQKIDGKSLMLLRENDLRQPPISISTLGELKRLNFDILTLQQNFISSLQCSDPNQAYTFLVGGCNNAQQSQFSNTNLYGHHHGGIELHSVSSNTPPIYEDNSSFNNTTNHANNYNHNPNQFLVPPPPNSSHNNKTSGSHHRQILCNSQANRKTRQHRRKRKPDLIDSSDSMEFGSGFDDDPRSSAGEMRIPSSAKKSSPSHTGETRHILCGYANRLEPEIGKALLAMAYLFIVTWITALVMVIVHDRVPDMKKYPPLPDLFLDNMPHIPWAFEMCEVTGTILFCMWLGILFFHKHRFILLRRFFALSGTVFLLRCVTMLITSLSVPGSHLQCNPRVQPSSASTPYGDWMSRLYNAYMIWKGAGMSIQGVRTCGDYMFSGHTVALTMLNFFITEYTTRRLYFIHTISWLLNTFGIFFILAAHEHYSIDVFIAFYITSRLFLYYHTLANNQALMQRDSKRTKQWFPLFSFFESGVDGIVPNQYEWPITPLRLKIVCAELLNSMETKCKDLLSHPHQGLFMLRTNKYFFLRPNGATGTACAACGSSISSASSSSGSAAGDGSPPSSHLKQQ